MNIKGILVSMAMVVTAAAATGCSAPTPSAQESSSDVAQSGSSTADSLAKSATDWFAYRVGFGAPVVVARPVVRAYVAPVVGVRPTYIPGFYRRSLWVPGRYVVR